MGEFIEIGATSGPIGFVGGIVCVGVVGLFALMQNGSSDDDDSNGGGGGGLMQPVA